MYKDDILKQVISTYTPNDPSSLILLSKPEVVISHMYQNHIPILISIDISQTRQYQLTNTISSILKKDIHCFSSLTKTKNFIDNHSHKNVNDKIMIITCAQKFDYLKQIIENKCVKVTVIIVYPTNISSKYFDNGRTYHHVQTLNQVIKILCTYNFIKRQLPNFVSIKHQLWTSNLLLKTMKQMLNSKLNRFQLIIQLQNLLNLIPGQQQNKKQFITYLQTNEQDRNQTILWYTKESFVYGFVNNMLRANIHPFQLYYIQPYFYDLFTAINHLYNQQKDKYKEDDRIVCYRGGIITQKQIEYLQQNQGVIVRNLGFLSASTKKNMNWVINALFIIHIKKQKRQVTLDHGFAFINQFSAFKSQQEVLFNPLNDFKIISVRKELEKGREYYQVVMEYGYIAAILQKQTLQNNEKQQYNHYKVWFNAHYSDLVLKKCQGQILFFNRQAMLGCEEYWQKFYSISQTIQQKAQALSKLGIMDLDSNKKSILKQKVNQLQISKLPQQLQLCFLCFIGSWEYHFKNLANLETIVRKCEKILKEFGENIPLKIRISVINLRVLLSFQKQNYQQMNFYSNLILDQSQKILEQGQPQTFHAFLNSISCNNEKNPKSLIPLTRTFSNIIKNTYGQQYFIYLTALCKLCGLYIKSNQLKKAKQVCDHCIHIRDKYKCKNLYINLGILVQKKKILSLEDKYQQNLEVLAEILEIMEFLFGKDHYQYYKIQIRIAQTYNFLKKPQKSIQIISQHKKLIEKLPTYSKLQLLCDILCIQSYILHRRKQYKISLNLQKQFFAIISNSKNSVDQNLQSIQTRKLIALSLINLHRYQQAQQQQSIVLIFYEKNLYLGQQYQQSLRTMLMIYRMLKIPKKVFQLYQKLLKIKEIKYGISSIQYYQSMVIIDRICFQYLEFDKGFNLCINYVNYLQKQNDKNPKIIQFLAKSQKHYQNISRIEESNKILQNLLKNAQNIPDYKNLLQKYLIFQYQHYNKIINKEKKQIKICYIDFLSIQ